MNAAAEFLARLAQLQAQGNWTEADAEVRAVLDALHEQGIGGSTLLEYVTDLNPNLACTR